MQSRVLFSLLLAARLWWSSTATFIPLTGAGSDTGISERDADTRGMRWEGEIFKGAAPTVLFGDIESIYKQILAINPNYAPKDSAEAMGLMVGKDLSVDELGTKLAVLRNNFMIHEDPLAAQGNNSTKRQQDDYPRPPGAEAPTGWNEPTKWIDDTVHCRSMATGNYNDAVWAWRVIHNVGGSCATPANECRRTTCYDTTGTYLCSHTDRPLRMPCFMIAGMIQQIVHICKCQITFLHTAVTGAYDQRDMSVWAGYANCNHPPDFRPNLYVYPGGSNNGKC